MARVDLSARAVQPISLWRTRPFQMPSHARLSPLMPKIESAIRPDGFISKKYPDRSSRNVSIVHMKRSSAGRNSSRRR
jgi:hypothetical protein